MAVLTWGEPIHEYVKSESGKPKTGESWKALDIPKDGTLRVEEQEGQEVTAVQEGGAIVDSRRGDPNVSTTFSLFVKAGKDLPFEGKKGQIEGEYAYRIRGKADHLIGVIIERASVYAKVEFSSAEGILVTYTIKGLVPAEGDILKLKKSAEIKDAQVG